MWGGRGGGGGGKWDFTLFSPNANSVADAPDGEDDSDDELCGGGNENFDSGDVDGAPVEPMGKVTSVPLLTLRCWSFSFHSNPNLGFC